MPNSTFDVVASLALLAFISILVYLIYLGSPKDGVYQGAWYIQPTTRSQIGGGVVTAIAFAVGLFVPGLFNSIGHTIILIGLLFFVLVLVIGAIRLTTMTRTS